MNWPDTMRRVRLANSLTQCELADWLGADPSQVSKWERGKLTPGARVQRQLRAFVLRHDPSLSHEAVKLSPVAMAIVKEDNLAGVVAVSAVAANAYGLTADEGVDTDWWKVLPEPILDIYTAIMETDGWPASYAGYEMKVLRGNEGWHRAVGLCVPAAGLVSWNAAPCTPPEDTSKPICEVKLLTMDNPPSCACSRLH